MFVLVLQFSSSGSMVQAELPPAVATPTPQQQPIVACRRLAPPVSPLPRSACMNFICAPSVSGPVEHVFYWSTSKTSPEVTFLLATAPSAVLECKRHGDTLMVSSIRIEENLQSWSNVWALLTPGCLWFSIQARPCSHRQQQRHHSNQQRPEALPLPFQDEACSRTPGKVTS